MESATLPFKIRDLQAWVAELLTHTSTLINRTQQTLQFEANSTKYSTYQGEIERIAEQVKNLKLVMSIVAPMKAGKSTIINSIVGQTLLPSRNSAMTTLPTEIVFNPEIPQPILKLNPKFLSVFQASYQSLRSEIEILGIDLVKHRIAQYPHLIHLAETIQTEKQLLISPQTQGSQEISRILTILNDIVRLCIVISPNHDPLINLTEVPTIETPLSSSSKNSQQLGNLAIVDTPGPNEAGEHMRLHTVVQNQLRRSSMVLIVLDFTQLNNQAAEAIKAQVKPIIQLLGKENLYVLINKIDQRRPGDMTTEQVKEFVLADLGFEQSQEQERIFEVSAVQAFYANRFLLDCQQNPAIHFQNRETTSSLAQEVFGIDWEEELAETNQQILAKKAQRLWQKSGFAPFLDKAIERLMSTAAPRVIISGLNLCQTRLLELEDELNLRNQAINQDAVKLEKEIANLSQDIQELTAIGQNLLQVNQIKQLLQTSLQKIITEVKQQSRVTVDDYLTQKNSLLKKRKIKQKSGKQVLNLGNLTTVTSQPPSELENKLMGIASFQTLEEAEKFTEQAINWAKHRAENLLFQVRNNITDEIVQVKTQIRQILSQEIQPIAERAKVRIKDNLDVNLSLPIPKFQETTELCPEEALIKSKTKLVDQGYGEKMIERRAWYYWLWLAPFYEKETYKKPYKTENYYSVSLNELVKEINQEIEQALALAQQQISHYLEEDLEAEVEKLFTQVDNYLNNYCTSLKQTQIDQQLDLQAKEKLAINLRHLIVETNKNLEKTVNYINLAHKLI